MASRVVLLPGCDTSRQRFNSHSSGPNTLHAHNIYLTNADSRKIRAREVVPTLARWSRLYVNCGCRCSVLAYDGFEPLADTFSCKKRVCLLRMRCAWRCAEQRKRAGAARPRGGAIFQLRLAVRAGCCVVGCSARVGILSHIKR